jgi:hypothetical protein
MLVEHVPPLMMSADIASFGNLAELCYESYKREKDNMYHMNVFRDFPAENVPTDDHVIGSAIAAGSSLNLLHRRLGHPGMPATRELQNGNAVLGLMHDLHACKGHCCEVCTNSKEHRAHFAPSPPQAHSSFAAPLAMLQHPRHPFFFQEGVETPPGAVRTEASCSCMA